MSLVLSGEGIMCIQWYPMVYVSNGVREEKRKVTFRMA